MGVASVALLRAAVRRWAGPAAGLLAGAVLALTPAAVLMFRFDNPDALLVLLLVAGAYATVRAVDAASTRAATGGWSPAGAAVGFGFLTKMGRRCWSCRRSALVYLVAGPTRLRTRLLQLLGRARRDGRLGRLVRRAGRAVARRLAALHRRLDDELAAGAGPGLQRPRPDPRRERQRRRRWRRGGGEQPASAAPPGITRLFTDELGLRDLLAAAGGADRPGRRARG